MYVPVKTKGTEVVPCGRENLHFAHSRQCRFYFLSGTLIRETRMFPHLADYSAFEAGATAEEQRRALSGHVIYRIKEEIYDWTIIHYSPKGYS